MNFRRSSSRFLLMAGTTSNEEMKKANKARQIDGHKLLNFIPTSLQPRPRLRF